MASHKAFLTSGLIAVSLSYLKNWQLLGWSDLVLVGISYWLAYHGLSSRYVKTKAYQWILERMQRKRSPLVFKPNIFGSSAREVGTIIHDLDHEVELRKSKQDALNFRMFDKSNDSWLLIGMEYLDERTARVNLSWFYKVRTNAKKNSPT